MQVAHKSAFATHAFTQIFASHAIGGLIGNILTGLFAQSSVAAFDGITSIPGGWLDHHYIQLGYQLADSVAGMSYSFVVTVSSFARFFPSVDGASPDHYSLAYALHPLPPPPGDRGSRNCWS